MNKPKTYNGPMGGRERDHKNTMDHFEGKEQKLTMDQFEGTEQNPIMDKPGGNRTKRFSNLDSGYIRQH